MIEREEGTENANSKEGKEYKTQKFECADGEGRREEKFKLSKTKPLLLAADAICHTPFEFQFYQTWKSHYQHFLNGIFELRGAEEMLHELSISGSRTAGGCILITAL